MTYLYAFLFCGAVCLVGQLILDNSQLTAGHITSALVVVGSVLGFLGYYEIFQKAAGMGASLPITSFGNQLYLGGMEGYADYGILGIFSGMLTKVSAGIIATIIFSAFLSFFFEPND